MNDTLSGSRTLDKFIRTAKAGASKIQIMRRGYRGAETGDIR
jgi:hypothetical protein